MPDLHKNVVLSGTTKSTPTHDKKPTKAVGNELELAVNAFQAETSAFAQSIIKDPKARLEYLTKSKEASQEIIRLVKEGKITPHEGAITLSGMRNELMALARAKLSDFGLALSVDMKKEGKALAELEEKYAFKIFKRSFTQLSESEKNIVWKEIIEAAGRGRPSVSQYAKLYGKVGRGFLIISLGFAVYEITTAENKGRETAKQGSILAAGVAGGAAGVAGLGFIVSNPVGWAVGAAMFVGAGIAVAADSSAFDYFWPEK